MALEPITRQEQIIAGKDLEPITRMEKFLKQYGGGGGGFEYDFIIRVTEDEQAGLETGTYASILEKLGTRPINGRLLLSLGEGDEALKTDASICYADYVNGILRVYATNVASGNITTWSYTINPDNTIIEG